MAASASTETLRPFVVLVSGAPGAGKTTLGRQLSQQLHVPFLSRDDVKTGLHVTHRSDDPDEAWRFAERAFEVFFGSIALLVRSGVSVVGEAAFHAGRAEQPIAALSSVTEVIHIRLTTPEELALERYIERSRSRPRHPSHNDAHFAERMADGSKSTEVYRLSLPYPTLAVDGSAGWEPGIDDIVSFVERSR